MDFAWLIDRRAVDLMKMLIRVAGPPEVPALTAKPVGGERAESSNEIRLWEGLTRGLPEIVGAEGEIPTEPARYAAVFTQSVGFGMHLRRRSATRLDAAFLQTQRPHVGAASPESTAPNHFLAGACGVCVGGPSEFQASRM
jgi:hypothetical protein